MRTAEGSYVTDDCGFDLAWWFYAGFPRLPAVVLPHEDVKVPLTRETKYGTSDEVDTFVIITGEPTQKELVRVHPNLWVAAGEYDNAETLCLLPACTPPAAAKAYMSAVYLAWKEAQAEIGDLRTKVAEIENTYLWLGFENE